MNRRDRRRWLSHFKDDHPQEAWNAVLKPWGGPANKDVLSRIPRNGVGWLSPLDRDTASRFYADNANSMALENASVVTTPSNLLSIFPDLSRMK